MHEYTVFFYLEWGIPEPMYYRLGDVRGATPQKALDSNLPQLIQAARKACALDALVDEEAIAEGFYIVRSDQWLSSREIYWQASLGDPVEA